MILNDVRKTQKTYMEVGMKKEYKPDDRFQYEF